MIHFTRKPMVFKGTSWDISMFHLFLNRFHYFSGASITLPFNKIWSRGVPFPELHNSRGHFSWDPFWGNESWCKSMVILRISLRTMHCLRWVIYDDHIDLCNTEPRTGPQTKKMRSIKIAGGFVSPSIDKTFWLGSNRWSPMPWCKGWKQTWGRFRDASWSMGGIYYCLEGSPEKNWWCCVDFINVRVPCSFFLQNVLKMKVWQNDSEETKYRFWLRTFWSIVLQVHLLPQKGHLGPWKAHTCIVVPYRKWCGPRLSRIRNPDLKPFVAAEASASERTFVELRNNPRSPNHHCDPHSHSHHPPLPQRRRPCCMVFFLLLFL